jgi:hypothetical protein
MEQLDLRRVAPLVTALLALGQLASCGAPSEPAPALLKPGSASRSASGPYTPKFSFDEKKGIFDRGEPIAKIAKWKLDESRPALDFVVLQRGRPASIAEIPCFWLTQEKLTNLQVEATGEDTDRLTVAFRAEEEQGRYIDERVVVVTHDPAIDSYVYTFDATFTVQDGQTYSASYLEFFDPHWIHLGFPGPSIPLAEIESISDEETVWPTRGPAEEWRPLFQFYAYEAADGNVYKITLNHRVDRPTQRSLPLKDGAILAAVYNSERGNPAFQLLGDTAARTEIEACHWGYDSHMRLKLSENEAPVTLEAGEIVTARVKVFQLPDQQALDLMRRARPRPMPPEEILSTFRPAFHLHSRFEESSDPYKTGGDTDPGYWDVFRPERKPWNFLSKRGPVWSTSMGHGDSYSVGSVHAKPGLSGWTAVTGVSQWTGAAPPRDKVWKITAFVKTDGVTGKGAFIAVEQNKIGTRESKALTGTRGWTELSLLAPQGWGQKGNSYLHLRLDGAGSAWFDDVRLEVVDHRWD